MESVVLLRTNVKFGAFLVRKMNYFYTVGAFIYILSEYVLCRHQSHKVGWKLSGSILIRHPILYLPWIKFFEDRIIRYSSCCDRLLFDRPHTFAMRLEISIVRKHYRSSVTKVTLLIWKWEFHFRLVWKKRQERSEYIWKFCPSRIRIIPEI